LASSFKIHGNLCNIIAPPLCTPQIRGLNFEFLSGHPMRGSHNKNKFIYLFIYIYFFIFRLRGGGGNLKREFTFNLDFYNAIILGKFSKNSKTKIKIVPQ
jgi:hypothetical protein